MSVFTSPALIESTTTTPIIVAEERSRPSRDAIRWARTRMALVALATISGIALLIWILSKHILIQIPWRSGLIQIGNADPLREHPNTFLRIGNGGATPVHIEGGDRSFFHFSTNNLAKPSHERRVVMTRNGMVEKLPTPAAAGTGVATATSPAAHVPATTPAAAAAAATAATTGTTTKMANKAGACETYAAEYIQHQMGVLQGTIVPSAEVNNALKAKLAACVKGMKAI